MASVQDCEPEPEPETEPESAPEFLVVGVYEFVAEDATQLSIPIGTVVNVHLRGKEGDAKG